MTYQADGERCRDCPEDAIGWVSDDPYDVISGSPLSSTGPVPFCLFHYNERVMAALRYIMRRASQDPDPRLNSYTPDTRWRA
jgi:hypothetical protein